MSKMFKISERVVNILMRAKCHIAIHGYVKCT